MRILKVRAARNARSSTLRKDVVKLSFRDAPWKTLAAPFVNRWRCTLQPRRIGIHYDLLHG